MMPSADWKILARLVLLLYIYSLTACSTESNQAVKTQTMVNTPKPTVASSIEFTIDSSTKKLPDGFMDEIFYFNSGIWPEEDPCKEKLKNLLSYEEEPKDEIYVYEPYVVSTCGWDPYENIRVTVQLMDGEIIATTGQSDKYGYFSYSLTPTADDLPGEYSVEISGNTGKLKTNFSKNARNETGSFLDNDILVLYNFTPLEKIRLIIYQDNSENYAVKLKFIGWQDYHVDVNGDLRIYIDLGLETRVQYQIYAEKSGSYPSGFGFDCNGKGGSFAIGDKVQVVYQDGIPFFESRIESRSGIQKADRVLEKGELAMVTAGPICRQGIISWLFELSDGSSGWIQEETHEGNKHFEVIE